MKVKDVRVISKDEFEAMTPAQQNQILLKHVKIRGVGVVRDAQGNIKYGPKAQPGDFGEDTLKED